ncbi:hypothetical protein A2U01_0118705, partial [Trifolium medium]|nr:hypothetical protein [Trifolium medium]
MDRIVKNREALENKAVELEAVEDEVVSSSEDENEAVDE